ncbi:SDR family NAD(P)-dependent oxidoreductase [Pseudonocardia sp. CA-107938]|uniref:SDR family NAD(P)-dependent oxidoreductase n=1 Tax=Pseudonocardia sp. CA-107938 TaxID=3240021 RepID=UPI003D8B4F20
MEINGRTALVTGAAAGAGRAIAGALESAGARVVGADLTPDAGIRLDVTDDAALVAALEDVRPDILINNAGGGGHVLPHYPDASVAEWSGWLDLNLRAPMLATQVALRCGAGAVVNVASMAGLGAEPHPSPEYAAAKAGLIRFTTSLADPRVSCLVPGWIRTERAEAELAAMTPDERAAAPVPISLDALCTAVLQLVTGPGRVLVLP